MSSVNPLRNKRMNTITPENIAHMHAVADELGEHFAKEPNREKVLIWLHVMRNELVDVCSPVTNLRDLRHELDEIDRMLDRIESRRAEIRSSLAH